MANLLYPDAITNDLLAAFDEEIRKTVYGKNTLTFPPGSGIATSTNAITTGKSLLRPPVVISGIGTSAMPGLGPLPDFETVTDWHPAVTGAALIASSNFRSFYHSVSMLIPLAEGSYRPYKNQISDAVYSDNLKHSATVLFHEAGLLLDAWESTFPKRFKIIRHG